MNFLLPYSWLKEYVDVPKDPHQLARLLSQHGPSVERVIRTKHEWTAALVVVAEILELTKHPNADKLQLATVTTGNKKYQIVCGAPNIVVGQKVPLALAGAVLPGDFVIQEREVRGVKSQGMLCSARELGIHDDHVGIMVLHPSTKVGVQLVSLGVAEDYLLDVESTTNRPDAASAIGMAREVSAITGKSVKLPNITKLPKHGRPAVKVIIEDKKGCRRFMGLVMEHVTNSSSPWWMQERLVRAGVRPISAIVDITNYVMLEYAQPMHAYDLDKLGGNIKVRRAKAGESLRALDGNNYKLDKDHLVIAGQAGPAGIAGIMGDESTGVTANTKRILFEAAAWDPVLVRRMSRDLVLASDASRLYEKGLSVEALPIALARARDLAEEITGGQVTGGVIDEQRERARPLTIRFPLSEVKRITGEGVKSIVASRFLKALGFGVSGSGSILTVKVPYWRDHDVLEAIDLVEEIARLKGYHHLTSVLPEATLGHIGTNDVFDREDLLRGELIKIGFTEVVSNAFVTERMLTAAAKLPGEVLQLENPMNSEFMYLRPSLLPSLLAVIEKNQANITDQSLFEIGNIYERGQGKGLDGYRRETMRLNGMIVRRGATDEDLYRMIRGVVEHLVIRFGRKQESVLGAPDAPFASSAAQRISLDNFFGTLGLIDSRSAALFGIAHSVVAFDIPLAAFTEQYVPPHAYQPPPKFPAIKRDLALVVAAAIDYTALASTLQSCSPLIESVELVDVYRGSPLANDKVSLTVRVIFRAADKTLQASEVDQVEARLLAAVAVTHAATLRS